jgi:predicted nucleic acid-binding protein
LSTFFFDTSALAKRYLSEIGSAWARNVLHPAAGHVVMLSDVTTVELPSLLARRVREGTLAPANASALGSGFLLHVEKEYLMLPLDAQVLKQGRALVAKYPLRALDAIQLASAQVATVIAGEPIAFVTSDRNLVAAAIAEGFVTDDPLAHP